MRAEAVRLEELRGSAAAERVVADDEVAAAEVAGVAAERVVADDEVAAAEVAGVAAELVDKSMVSVERTDGTVRCRLLDTLREFGAARLAEAGATDTVRRAHAAYHVALAEHLGPRMRGPDEKAASSSGNPISGSFFR